LIRVYYLRSESPKKKNPW